MEQIGKKDFKLFCITHTKKEAKKWSKLARLSLQPIPQSSIKNKLEEISNYIISRTS